MSNNLSDCSKPGDFMQGPPSVYSNLDRISDLSERIVLHAKDTTKLKVCVDKLAAVVEAAQKSFKILAESFSAGKTTMELLAERMGKLEARIRELEADKAEQAARHARMADMLETARNAGNVSIDPQAGRVRPYQGRVLLDGNDMTADWDEGRPGEQPE